MLVHQIDNEPKHQNQRYTEPKKSPFSISNSPRVIESIKTVKKHQLQNVQANQENQRLKYLHAPVQCRHTPTRLAVCRNPVPAQKFAMSTLPGRIPNSPKAQTTLHPEEPS